MLLDNLNDEIKKLLTYLKKCKTETEVLPEGKLRISVERKHISYYVHTNNSKSYYSQKSEKPKQIAQYQYYKKLIPLIEDQLHVAKKLQLMLQENKIEKVYSNMHPVRKQLVEPIEKEITDFVKSWLEVKYIPNPFVQDNATYLTLNKERVRSKTEKIIADTFSAYNIPYRYEFPFKTKEGKIYYPDFTILNKRTRKEFIFEHFGRIDDENYLNKNCLSKLHVYYNNNLIFGKNFLFTMESKNCPFNQEDLEKLIEQYLL